MGRLPLRLALDVKTHDAATRLDPAKRAGSNVGRPNQSYSGTDASPIERGASAPAPASAPAATPANAAGSGPGLLPPGAGPRSIAAAFGPASYTTSAASAGPIHNSKSSGGSNATSNGANSSGGGPGALGHVGHGWALLRGGHGGRGAAMAAAAAAAAPPSSSAPVGSSGPLSGQALAFAAMNTCSNAERELKELLAAAPPPPSSPPAAAAATATSVLVPAAPAPPVMPPLRRPALALPHHFTRNTHTPPTGRPSGAQAPPPPRKGAFAMAINHRQLLPPGSRNGARPDVNPEPPGAAASAVATPPLPPRSPQRQPRPRATPPPPSPPPPLPLPPPAPDPQPVAALPRRRSTTCGELGAAKRSSDGDALAAPGSPPLPTLPSPAPAPDALEAGSRSGSGPGLFGPPPDPLQQPPPPATPQQPLMAVLRDLASMSANHLTDSFNYAVRHRTHSIYAAAPPSLSPPASPSRDSTQRRGSGSDMQGTGTRRRASDGSAYFGAGAGAATAATSLAAVVGTVTGHARSGPAPSITAAAMRAVAGLQELDEYSLVAAARQRMRRAAAGKARSMSVQPGLAAGGGGGGGGGAAAGAGGGGGGGGVAAAVAALTSASRKSLGPHMSLRTLLTASEHGHLQSSRSLTSLPLLMAARHSEPADSAAAASAAAASAAAAGQGSPPSPASAALAAVLGSPRGGGAARLASKSFRIDSGAAAATSAATAPETPTLPPLPARGGALSRSLTGIGAMSMRSASSFSAAGGAVLVPGRMAASEAGGGAAAAEATRLDDAAAAAAAVRALASRFGTVVPAEGLMEAEAELAFRERSKRLMEALVAANPAAYQEEAAEAAEAAYRALSERAKFRLRVLLEEACTGEAPWRQLESSLRELTSQRPFFLPPVVPRPKIERPQLEVTRAVKQTVWSADDSIFAQRKKENEARDLYDTDKIHSAQLLIDWKRVAGKTRFRRMIARGDAGVRNDGQSLDEEIAEVREELERQADFIRATFTYYSMLGGQGSSSDVLQINAGSWLSFCNDAGIVGPARGCTLQDMQMIFVAVNFEEESETVEADANDDDAMVRFEFMEGLVRAAFGKYITSKRMTDASDAVGVLLEEIKASPNLPPEALVIANDFRRNRFYTQEVEEVVKEYYDLLLAAFKLYKARDRAKYFWPEHWFAFLEANQLLGLATGVERREAKLIFAWSQAVVTDELRRRQRAVSLTLWDFIEAVARLADLISPPDPEFMIEFFLHEGRDPPELERICWEYYRRVGDAGTELKRESAELVVTPTRPLSVKLRLLMQYLTCSLREAWGGRDAKDVASKVSKMATYLCGGIEMG